MIVQGATADGDRAFDANEDAPEGADLHAQIARAQFARRVAEQQAEWDKALRYDADADAATRAFFAAQKAQAGG